MMKQKFMLFECLMAVSFSIQALLPNIFTPLVSLLTFTLITAVKHKYEGFRSTYVFFLMIQATLMIFSYSIIRVSVALFAYAVLAYFPLYDFPNTKGPFMVGYKNLSLPQNLNVSVFYPTVQKTKKAPYKIEKETWIRMSDFLRSIPGNIIPELVFRILFSFIDHVDIGANLDAQIISPQLLTYNQKFPVIVFSPGTAGNRNFYTGFARQWASFGYIVFSIDHDEPCRLQFNSVEELKQIRIPHLQERCRLIRSMTDFVYDLHELKNFFQDWDLEIDYDRVSLAGHSFGGAAAAEVALDSRITGALILLDPWFFPSRSEVVETPANRPVLVVRTEGFANFIPEFKVLETIQTFVQSNKQQYQDQSLCCYFKNATHKSFTDMIIHMPREMKMIGTVKDFNDIEEIYDSQTMVTQMFLDTMLYAPKYETVSKKNMMIEAFESYLVSNGAKSQLQVDDF